MPGPYPGHLFHVEKGTPVALAFPFFSGVAQAPQLQQDVLSRVRCSLVLLAADHAQDRPA